MARVISESDAVRETEVRCKKCRRLVAYLPEDVKRRDGLDYTGDPDGCKYVVCPGCRERIVLESW